MLNNKQLLEGGKGEGQRKKEEGRAVQVRPGQNGVKPQQYTLGGEGQRSKDFKNRVI